MFLLSLPCVSHLHCAHPIYFLNKLLSHGFWLPIATLSYSIYLFHMLLGFFVGSTPFAVPDFEVPLNDLGAPKECQFDTKF